MAIEPENTTERKKLAEVLDMLKRRTRRSMRRRIPNPVKH
jgi:hypothetical protein